MRLWLGCVWFLGVALLTAMGATPGEGRQHQPRMSWLKNDEIRVGVDLELGGAITWLSKAGETADAANTINSWDWGRQVQMSFYGGPVPFSVGEKKPAKHWAGLGWNPIQVGDDYGHRSRVLEHRNDGRELYVKCIPMQWPLENVPGECTFEWWLHLEGKAVRVRGRLTNARADRQQYEARPQELPAVYTNGAFCRIVSYTGAAPFTHGPLEHISPQPPPEWGTWEATEHWSALLNYTGSLAVGVWNPAAIRFGGGFAGEPGAGGSKDSPCGYLTPQGVEVLDHNIQFDFEFALILGTVEQIRAFAYAHHPPAAAEHTWTFTRDRQHWFPRHAQDAGWPLAGAWRVHWQHEDPNLVSGLFGYGGERDVTLEITGSLQGQSGPLRVYWAALGGAGLNEERTVNLPLTGDGQERVYRVVIPGTAGKKVSQLRLDPPGAQGRLEVKRITLRLE